METKDHLRKWTSFKSLVLILGLILFLGSCEGYRCADGIIYDSATKVPIDSVKCTVISVDKQIAYSDSLGKYSVCNHFGGCVPDCPDIIIEFSKTGYQTRTIKNPNKSDIFLDKE